MGLKFLKSLIFNYRGQISLETGILIAAVLAVTIFSAYIYVKSIVNATVTVNESTTGTVGAYNAEIGRFTESVYNLTNK
ncbi:conserved hypothetical protein [Methanococcus vannielii SB]|uniref:Class III signal peptide-containing protein n=1 Tax=Methanococcus vannielii (strain ATCC 35089 / DSM 1224 / JCM 13029 / OCM 148 / SB) TaxID=406327 RepID=A6UN61_METVS|nr:class III signal peptide-containing protein [Methanococcus vannielii]ABR53933.1 conserved hypothetical protein [Methanococcus vannielii SB]